MVSAAGAAEEAEEAEERGFQPDPNMIFNMLAPNSDFLTEAQYLANPCAGRDPNAKDQFESFMQRNGITNGGLNREQFAQFLQERMAQRQAERAAANPGGENPADPNASAASDPNAATDDGEPPPPEDKRPTVYRVGNLPPGLPAWFATYDSDRDGQVGLYEWKAAGASVSDFQKIDLNGDGFITMDEAMRYQKSQGVTAVASNAPSYPGASSARAADPPSSRTASTAEVRAAVSAASAVSAAAASTRAARTPTATERRTRPATEPPARSASKRLNRLLALRAGSFPLSPLRIAAGLTWSYLLGRKMPMHYGRISRFAPHGAAARILLEESRERVEA